MMLGKLFRALHYIKLKWFNNRKQDAQSGGRIGEQDHIPRSIRNLKEKLGQTFSDSGDFILREISLGEEPQVKIIIAFIDGLTKRDEVEANILQPLMIESRKVDIAGNISGHSIIPILKEKLLSTADLQEIKSFKDTVEQILCGNTVIYIEGKKAALSAGTRGWKSRALDEPATEAVVRGPREGFTETLRINTALIRRKLKNSRLKFEIMRLGEETGTDVAICYIQGIAPNEIIETVRKRLKEIRTDAILESGYIEEFIEDAPFTIFSTVGNSEKPDIVAAKLLEGRVAILCDGTPFVLTVPYLFIESFQASEDYYNRASFSSLVRVLRIVGFIISTVLPAFYVALITFHQDVIPFQLLLTITASREGIPFSAFFEVLFMATTFELLREAGVRMPRTIGQAVSIVGALVLGESAVKAGLASNAMVIVTALTAISSFLIPALAGTMPFVRLILLVAANFLGFLGMTLSIALFLIHMSSLRSFGVPYLAPFSPLQVQDLKDTFLRVPIWAMRTRPRALTGENGDREQYRMKTNLRRKEDQTDG